jgi:hypothetical protein
VNAESEGALTQFHRIAYSSNPSRFLDSARPLARVTPSSLLGVISPWQGRLTGPVVKCHSPHAPIPGDMVLS